MRTQVRLNLYERGIVDALVASFGYTAAAARMLVTEYIGVVRKLGGYDTCYDHAERLNQAHKKKYPAEAWLERIEALDRGAAQDKGIAHLERGPAYAHVH
ncbi:hypothetical protein [Paenibacillus abyssi]|uniref:Uncharacterized protein n=1 Tax=Paenibacillus abyssi TaxID=1340531 RepID=A0A917G2F8_9BACL|nr:hypothetical protein [Paenibacillus abyssi]GGG18538.1 hypothetical protein GCM10010916_39190 [Paenibacillus abyssi]